MTRSMHIRKLKIQTRIALLESRQTDNGNIIKKLKRQLRKIESME